MEIHDLMGGKLHVYKRDNSRFWQCSTYLAGKNRRITTKEESLAHAKEIAEDWYLELREKRVPECSHRGRPSNARSRRSWESTRPLRPDSVTPNMFRRKRIASACIASVLRQPGAHRDHARPGARVSH